MTKVSILPCNTYDVSLIKTTITEHMKNIGFDPKLFKNKKVAIKPNFLWASPPEKAIITHPLFFRAVAEIVIEHKGEVFLIESPAMDSLRKVFKIGGYLEVLNDLPVTIADQSASEVLFYDKNERFKRFSILSACVDMDIIINLPKLKTHCLTLLTCAVKNLFGLVPGLEKTRWHMRAGSKDDFCRFLVDLNHALVHGFEKPKMYLHFVDGITGIEGDGPGTAGTPRDYGVILAGMNAVAVDYAAVILMGIDPSRVTTIQYGLETGFDGVSSPNDITFAGSDPGKMVIDKVRLPGPDAAGGILSKWPFTMKFVRNIIVRWFIKKPIPVPSQCVLCYKCEQICPVGAITRAKKNKKVPSFDYKKCIRCFCCHEICPEAAIALK